MIEISKKEYIELLARSLHLGELEAGGVDNWIWYGKNQNEYIKSICNANGIPYDSEELPEYEEIAQILAGIGDNELC